jgi:hypothetical protein
MTSVPADCRREIMTVHAARRRLLAPDTVR